MLEQDDQPCADNPLRSAIIKDLLKNRPSGPEGNSITYKEELSWCHDKGRQVKQHVPSDPYYGYDKRVLFNLGIRSLDDVRKVLRIHNFAGKFSYGSKKRTYTRQCNRLWQRLEPAIKSIIKAGGQGVYRVVHKSARTSYTLRETSIGFVYAYDYKEATNMSRLMFGYLVKDPENIESVFTRFGTEEALLAYNTRATKKIDDRLSDMNKSLDHTKNKIKKLQNMRQAVMNVTLSMCGANETD
jgi:hypothetical protein